MTFESFSLIRVFFVTFLRSGYTLFVKDFIDFNTTTWKDNLMRDIFNLLEVEIILNMYFKPNCMDYPMWYHSSHGYYNFQSDYQVSLG